MAKSLSERIAARMEAKATASRSAKNRAEVLAIRDGIAEALSDGWSVKVIWATLREEGKVTGGYQAFMANVQRVVRRKQKESCGQGSQDDQSTPVAATTKKREGKVAQGFKFDPKPNKESLI